MLVISKDVACDLYITNALFSAVGKDLLVLTPEGKYLQNKPKDFQAYAILDKITPNSQTSKEHVKNLLQNELIFNSNHRPARLFVPLAWASHAVLLVIEASNTPQRITLINSHGNKVNTYKEFEKAVMEAAKEVYPEAIFVNNQKWLWSNEVPCGYASLEAVRELIPVENAQNIVLEQKLKSRNKTADNEIRGRFNQEIEDLFQRYTKIAKENI